MYIDERILEIISKIEKENHEAYIVGGAVRDLLLNTEPKDYDIATNAHPDEIEKVFSDYKVIDIGKKYGTIMIIYKSEKVEITTYRKESGYKDGRRPENVKFSENLLDDLKRRDFTINAMAYNPNKGLVDYYNGKKDLKNNLIKTVGDPFERFEEDYLRILRAIRLSSQLDFDLDKKTFKTCKLLSENLIKLSPERIREEFFKILMTDKPSKGIELMREIKALKILFPEIYKTIDYDQYSPFHHLDLYEHTLLVLDNSKKKLEIRLAALLHDLGKVETQIIDENGIGRYHGHDKESVKIAENILRRLNSSKELINHVTKLIDSHMINNPQFKTKGIKRLIRKIGKEDIYDFIELQRADRAGIDKKYRDYSDIDEMEEKINYILENDEVVNENQLAIDGKDVLKLGYDEGKIIGEILQYAMDIVLEDSNLNDKEYLLGKIKNRFRRKNG